jgi:hypothetical protein
MKQYGLWVGFLLASLLPVPAQVGVEVVLEQQQFLPGESLQVAVRITNRSGRALRLGTEADWLTFAVETSQGQAVAKYSEVPVVGEFALESSEVATKRVDLGPCFSLEAPGRYQVSASLRIPNWDVVIATQPKSFDIVEGSSLWEQEFGVPPAAGATNSAPEVRKYVLKQIHYIPGRLRFYLSVEDASGKTLRVVPIGAVLSSNRNDPRVDSASNFHFMCLTGPHSFGYYVFNPDGQLIVRRTYDYTDTRPRLVLGDKGQVSVGGGARRFAADDFPAPKFLFPPPPPGTSTSSVPPVPAPATSP